MAQAHNVLIDSGVASGAITVYRFVVRSGSAGNSVSYAQVTGAQGEMDGVAAETVASGREVPVQMLAQGTIVKVEAGAAISQDAIVGSDTSGRAITAVSGAGNYEAGKALDAAAGAGEIIRVLANKNKDQA